MTSQRPWNPVLWPHIRESFYLRCWVFYVGRGLQLATIPLRPRRAGLILYRGLPPLCSCWLTMLARLAPDTLPTYSCWRRKISMMSRRSLQAQRDKNKEDSSVLQKWATYQSNMSNCTWKVFRRSSTKFTINHLLFHLTFTSSPPPNITSWRSLLTFSYIIV